MSTYWLLERIGFDFSSSDNVELTAEDEFPVEIFPRPSNNRVNRLGYESNFSKIYKCALYLINFLLFLALNKGSCLSLPRDGTGHITNVLKKLVDKAASKTPINNERLQMQSFMPRAKNNNQFALI